jgi:hypothetical protein
MLGFDWTVGLAELSYLTHQKRKQTRTGKETTGKKQENPTLNKTNEEAKSMELKNILIPWLGGVGRRRIRLRLIGEIVGLSGIRWLVRFQLVVGLLSIREIAVLTLRRVGASDSSVGILGVVRETALIQLRLLLLDSQLRGSRLRRLRVGGLIRAHGLVRWLVVESLRGVRGTRSILQALRVIRAHRIVARLLAQWFRLIVVEIGALRQLWLAGRRWLSSARRFRRGLRWLASALRRLTGRRLAGGIRSCLRVGTHTLRRARGVWERLAIQ